MANIDIISFDLERRTFKCIFTCLQIFVEHDDVTTLTYFCVLSVY